MYVSLFDYPWFLGAGLFFSLFIALDLGYRLASRNRANSDPAHHEQIVSLRDGMLLLLTFLVGFTFAMALSRYDHRGALLVEEANAIRAASLRARMLPEGQQAELMELLRQYADSRMELFEAGLDVRRRQAALRRADQLQGRLWDASVAIGHRDDSPTFVEFMLALNDAIGLADKRLAAKENRIPFITWALIVFIALCASFTAGYSLEKPFWLLSVALPLTISVTFSLIADLDAPSSGFTGTGYATTARLQQYLHSDR